MTTTTDMAKDVKRSKRDVRYGTVISDKGDKTITVRYEFMTKHPKYGKYIRLSTKLRTHDEKNEARMGDRVEVVACRRLSKSKFWRLSRIVERGDQTVAPE